MPHPSALRRTLAIFAALTALTPLSAPAQGIDLPDDAIIEEQLAQLAQNVPGSIFALNPFRNAQSLTSEDGTTYTLTSLNPNVNSWFVLEIAPEGSRSSFVHFENGARDVWDISLIDEDGRPS